MARRDAMLGLLAQEQQQAQRPEKKQGMTLEEILRLAGGAAPIVGGVGGALAGSVIPGAGTAVGGAVGGGLGSLVGMGANMAADHMQQERESEQIEDEGEAMRELARKQRLASFL